MADGVLGRKKVVAVQLVEEEDRGAHGLATIQHLRAVVQPVLEALPKTPTATPSVVLSTVVGALGQTMEPAAKPVEEAPRPEPGLAPVHHLPVVEQPVPEAHTKTRTATPSAVLSTVAGFLGLPMEPAAILVGEEPRPEPGLAQVPLLPAVARPVLEALPKTPTATPSAVGLMLTVGGVPGLCGVSAQSIWSFLATLAVKLFTIVEERELEVALAHRHHAVELNVLETQRRPNPVSVSLLAFLTYLRILTTYAE